MTGLRQRIIRMLRAKSDIGHVYLSVTICHRGKKCRMTNIKQFPKWMRRTKDIRDRRQALGLKRDDSIGLSWGRDKILRWLGPSRKSNDRGGHFRNDGTY